MELEVKHLAPYLPYGLKLQYVVREKVKSIGVMQSISHNENETHPTRVSISAMHNEEHIWMFKPILKALSHFEYDHIVQIKEHIGIGQWCDHYDHYFDAWFDDAENVQKLILQCPYDIMQFFLECHFDVFGLIEANLATDLTHTEK
jgi:hypothetical protein